jgi:hypothetical protein
MGKRNRIKEARRNADADRIVVQLRTHRPAPAPTVATFKDLPQSRRDLVEPHRALALRPPEAWRCRLRSRAPERRFIDLVRFVFGAYPVPAHLEGVWNGAGLLCDGGPRQNDLCLWAIAVAQGRSLYRTAHGLLSRQEAHHFLTAPPGLSLAQAFWFATARAQAAEPRAALSVAASKLVLYPVDDVFWRDVARYFARHAIAPHQIDDLVDYIWATRLERPFFSLKGRPLPVLRRGMRAWRRELRIRMSVCGGSWRGSPLPDVYIRADGRDGPVNWCFTQIKTGNALYREGARMRHCVTGYKAECLAGRTSIWSLTYQQPAGVLRRGLTIELTAEGEIVQCRGFANRLPEFHELVAVHRWAAANGLQVVRC